MSIITNHITNKSARWLLLCGSLFWITGGLILSLRPGGDPPNSFRMSTDLMPLFAVGLLLLGVPFGYNLQMYKEGGKRIFKKTGLAVIISSCMYALGVLIRQCFLQATGWEPLMPAGFLAFIILWAVSGVICQKAGYLSRFAGMLQIVSAISLLTYNDQFNPYGAVAFGGMSFVFALIYPPRLFAQTEA